MDCCNDAFGGDYAYSPYGTSTTLGPDDGNPIQYTGRENDQTGLYYYRARYYDPVLKQWTSEDPIGLAGGINGRQYVGGNPVSFKDPRGLDNPGMGPYNSPVTVWTRPANIPGGDLLSAVGLEHQWIKTDRFEAGMGPFMGGIPAQDGRYGDRIGDAVQTTDQSGQSRMPGARQIPLPWPVDESCIDRCIAPGRMLGPWGPSNQCNTFVQDCLRQCRK